MPKHPGWHVKAEGGGQGVSAQRINMPKHPDKIPHVNRQGGGSGVSAQRVNMPKHPDKRPHVKPINPAGKG